MRSSRLVVAALTSLVGCVKSRIGAMGMKTFTITVEKGPHPLKPEMS